MDGREEEEKAERRGGRREEANVKDRPGSTLL